jgi:hypothetical protein
MKKGLVRRVDGMSDPERVAAQIEQVLRAVG